MSWARLGPDSDLYIFEDTRGGITCMWCRFETKDDFHYGDFNCETYPEMVEHVKKHIEAGHKVPDGLIEELEEAVLGEFRDG